MNTYAEILENKSLYKHLLFFFLTLFILFAYGYYFGTFDQASHIPFLKKTIDSTLFPGDYFFDLRESHYSYFWLLFIPFYKAKVLEISMFITYILTTYLTFWALWNLSKTLFNRPLTSLLVVISAALPHIGFSGLPLFEFSLLNRTACLPFEIVAFNYYLKKKYAASFLLLGVLYNFHALSVHFILAMMGTDMIVSFFKKRDMSVFRYIPLFFATAFPVLIWKFSHSAGVPLVAQWEWFQILNVTTFSHLFNFISFSNPIINFLTVGGGSAIILFYIAKKAIPANQTHETVSHFMLGGIFVLFTQLLTVSFYPVTIIVQAQVIRIGLFLSLFAYMYMSQMITTHSPSKNHFICFASSLIFSFSPLFFLLSLLFWQVKKTWILRMLAACSILLFTAILFALFYVGLAHPGIHVWPRKTAYYDVQLWAKKNTPISARFLIPPALWGLYEVEWRVGSERSAVCTLSELLEGAFDPSYISYWKPRFEDVAPRALKEFKGDTFENFQIANRAYYAHSTNEFVSLGKKYNAQYLVVEKKYKHNLPMVYENDKYTIYSL